jgi:hypothetical protein
MVGCANKAASLRSGECTPTALRAVRAKLVKYNEIFINFTN